ncbi:MAG: tRNA lysidine(34) synthetase TilS [Alphaproteobacteria bacterium]|nr:tRNA lysidine(34) synthetase TilS [Alphaproteobacteria bacterium]
MKLNKNVWVVGLSGGADSLCLTLLSNEYAKCRDIKLYACIVDHKLRPESSTEILPTIEILKQHSIQYKVFTWEHLEKITGSIEQRARKARYEFLYQYCQETGANILMTAHHALDQWETFFMRLSRGSALKGLASIQPVSNFKNILLARPLLHFTPDDIKETLNERFGITDYVKDPSNEQEVYERVRWREAYSELSYKYRLDINNINKAIERLQIANDCLDKIANRYLLELFDGEYINIQKYKSLHLELRIRILEKIIHNMSMNEVHIVSYSLLQRLAENICTTSFTAMNISGLIFRRDRSKNVKVFRENR